MHLTTCAMPQPTKYKPEIADAIIAQLCEGKSLTEICEQSGIPPRRTVEEWALDDREGFFGRFWRARGIGVLRLHDQALDALKDTSGDVITDTTGKVTINSTNISRLRETLAHTRWMMSRYFPEGFGDRIETLITGPGGGPVQVQATPFDLSKLKPDELRALESMLERAALPEPQE